MPSRSAFRTCSAARSSSRRSSTYPGIASLMVDAVTSRDMPLLQTCAMIFCCGLPRAGAAGGCLRDRLQSEAAQINESSHPQASTRRPACADRARRGAWRRLRKSIGLSGVIGVAHRRLLAARGRVRSLLAPHGVGEIVSYEVFEPMSGSYPLGTDYLGRDMLSRVMQRRAVSPWAWRSPRRLLASVGGHGARRCSRP